MRIDSLHKDRVCEVRLRIPLRGTIYASRIGLLLRVPLSVFGFRVETFGLEGYEGFSLGFLGIATGFRGAHGYLEVHG